MNKLSFVQKYYNSVGKNLTSSKYINKKIKENYSFNKGMFSLETKNNNVSSYKENTNILEKLNFFLFLEKKPNVFRSVVNKSGIKQSKSVKFMKNYIFSCFVKKWIQNNYKTLSPRFRVFKLTKKFIKITSWNVFSYKSEFKNVFLDTFSVSLHLPIKKGTFLSKMYKLQFLNLVKKT